MAIVLNVEAKDKMSLNSVLNNKISDWSKFKAFADDKINVTEKLKSVLGKVENTVGKGENAGFQQLVFFLQCFWKQFFCTVMIVWEPVNSLPNDRN